MASKKKKQVPPVVTEPQFQVHTDRKVMDLDTYELLDKCECVQGYKVGEVCRFCYAHGRRKHDDPVVKDACPLGLDRFRHRLYGDYYKTKLPFPSKPGKPEGLDKPVGEATQQEWENVQRIKADHANAMAEYEKLLQVYHDDASNLENQFVADLHEATGVPLDHPFGQAMYYHAYDTGHSAGYSEVASHFIGLLPLWEVAQKMVKAAIDEQRTKTT